MMAGVMAGVVAGVGRGHTSDSAACASTAFASPVMAADGGRPAKHVGLHCGDVRGGELL